MSAVLRYRKARMEYALETLKKEIAAFAKNVERRVNSARNKDDLSEARELLDILESANRFRAEISGSKRRFADTKNIFDYRLDI